MADMGAAIAWPHDWQPEARDALAPYFGRDVRVDIVLGPLSSIDGSRMSGFVYVDDGVPMIIHDHTGRPDVYPWRLLGGPVLRIHEIRPRRRPAVVFAHPGWNPRPGG